MSFQVMGKMPPACTDDRYDHVWGLYMDYKDGSFHPWHRIVGRILAITSFMFVLLYQCTSGLQRQFFTEMLKCRILLSNYHIINAEYRRKILIGCLFKVFNIVLTYRKLSGSDLLYPWFVFIVSAVNTRQFLCLQNLLHLLLQTAIGNNTDTV